MASGRSTPKNKAMPGYTGLSNTKSPSPQIQIPTDATPPPPKSFAQAQRPMSATAEVEHSWNDWANGFEIRFGDDDLGWIIDYSKIVVTAMTPFQVPIILSSNFGTVHPSGFPPSTSPGSLRAAPIPIQKQQLKALKGDILMTSVPDTDFRTTALAATSSKRQSIWRGTNHSDTTSREVEKRSRDLLPKSPLVHTDGSKEAGRRKRSFSMTQQGPKSESASGFSKQPTAPAPSKKDYEGTVPLAPAPITTADDTTNKIEDETSAHEGGNSRKRKASGQASSGREQPKKGSRSSNRNANLNQKSKGGKAFQDIYNQDAQLKAVLKGML